jgi:hypothetical protein
MLILAAPSALPTAPTTPGAIGVAQEEQVLCRWKIKIEGIDCDDLFNFTNSHQRSINLDRLSIA